MTDARVPPAGTDEAVKDVPHPQGLGALMLGCLGVVYGDIGTSPLYAFREALTAALGGKGIAPTPEAVLGVLSLIVWALAIVVTLKYVVILLEADNNGEGGTLALMALAQRAWRKGARFIVLLGVAGAALFFGDAIITPAISVLSAVEGLKLITPALDPYVVPVSLVILFALFAAQSRGTAKVATFFGPVMVLWFLVLAGLGVAQVIRNPSVLAAVNPLHAVSFIAHHPGIGLATLGAVFLAVTGGEALYADLGHFGTRPIRIAWFGFVLPALVLNYFGQGALVLASPAAIENPLYRLAPDAYLPFLVALATMASIIASQAVISGAFSLSRQAIQLGLLPRLDIKYTSASHAGQIFVPQVNMLLAIGVAALVLRFQNSDNLASAYGIAVTGAMVVDAIMGAIVIWRVWRWPLPAAIAIMLPLALIDATFLGANLLKFFEGGWIPVLLGLVLMTIMLTWRRGMRILGEKSRRGEVTLSDLIRQLERSPPHRVPGAAVFLTSDALRAPSALLHSLKHVKVLHEKNVVVSVSTADYPRLEDNERVQVERDRLGFLRVSVSFGFMETPNLPMALALSRHPDLKLDVMSTSYFLSRRSVRVTRGSGMIWGTGKLFATLHRNSANATDYFQIPMTRTIEIGTQVAI